MFSGLGGLSGLSSIFQVGAMLYGMNEMRKNQSVEASSLDDVKNKINGGKEGEVAEEVTEDGKIDSGANFLKTADSKTTKKSSGLGFSSNLFK